MHVLWDDNRGECQIRSEWAHFDCSGKYKNICILDSANKSSWSLFNVVCICFRMSIVLAEEFALSVLP